MNFEKMPMPNQEKNDGEGYKKETTKPSKLSNTSEFLKSKETPEDKAVALMRNSRSEQEWNDNCDKIKAENNGGYPGWWYEKIISSGVAAETQLLWKK